jgi:hypothetical protein
LGAELGIESRDPHIERLAFLSKAADQLADPASAYQCGLHRADWIQIQACIAGHSLRLQADS